MKLVYDLDKFREDLFQVGILESLPDKDYRVLMPLLDGCVECWVDHLVSMNDVLISILPTWSVAFVHRMPDEVQAFYFPGI